MDTTKFLKISMAAQVLIDRHGERALEMAQKIEELSVRPRFAAAVTNEIRRLLENHKH